MTSSNTTAASSSGVMRSRAAACLWGLYMGDALASPVHWFYDRSLVTRLFPGGIQRYEKPPLNLPGSILNVSNTGGPGRGPDSGEIIGNLIHHDKRKYWARGANYHYHCTLAAGECTLEAQLARRLLVVLAENGGAFDKSKWLAEFERFLTTPGSHNDTYASSYIRCVLCCNEWAPLLHSRRVNIYLFFFPPVIPRQFFANRQKGIPASEAADNDHHNTDAIDGNKTPCRHLHCLELSFPFLIHTCSFCLRV